MTSKSIGGPAMAVVALLSAQIVLMIAGSVALIYRIGPTTRSR